MASGNKTWGLGRHVANARTLWLISKIGPFLADRKVLAPIEKVNSRGDDSNKKPADSHPGVLNERTLTSNKCPSGVAQNWCHHIKNSWSLSRQPCKGTHNLSGPMYPFISLNNLLHPTSKPQKFDLKLESE